MERTTSTARAGGGDSVSIDGVGVVDPDFVSTGDIDFVDTSNTITANVKADSVALATDTTGNFVSDITSAQGLLLTGTEDATVGMIDCAATQILKRNAGDTEWECAADSTGGSPSFDAIASGTNIGSDMVVGSGATLKVNAGGELEASEFVLWVNNDSGSDIPICTAVYISDFDIPSDLPEVDIADADAAAMPAIGLTESIITNGSDGKVLSGGLMEGVDTVVSEGWAIGDSLYVNDSGTSGADCGATLTNVRPANTDDATQAVARVLRLHNTAGQLVVMGAGRANDVPNLQSAYFRVGNATNVSTAVQMGGDATMDNAGAVTVVDITATEEIFVDALGAEFEAGDALTDCTTFSATGGGIFFDDSEGVFKKCQDNVLTVLDTGGGGGSMPVKEVYFSAAGLSPLEPGDSIAPLVKDEGTNVDIFVRAFDDTTDECAGGTFAVPTDVDTSGTVTFRVRWYSATATTGDAMLDFRWHEVGDNEDWDAAVTTEEAGAITTAGTVDLITLDTWTETVSTLGWAANDVVDFMICRDANSSGTGSDTLVGDLLLRDLGIEIPRSE